VTKHQIRSSLTTSNNTIHAGVREGAVPHVPRFGQGQVQYMTPTLQLCLHSGQFFCFVFSISLHRHAHFLLTALPQSMHFKRHSQQFKSAGDVI
jgi:hypothetical protein